MLHFKRTAGFAVIELVVVLAVVGALFGGAKLWPKLFNGDANRAKQSAKTTTELVGATADQSAQAAASVTTMLTANATAPDSWQKDFIGFEGKVALSYLNKPDLEALARAEARMRAIAEGQRDEARRLYAEEQARAAKAEQRTLQAVAAKGRSDDDLARVAAERQGAEATRNVVILLFVLAAAGWAWTKFTHLSPAAVFDLRKDLDGIAPSAVQALDGVASRLQQRLAKGLRKRAEKKAAVAAVNAAP